MHLKINAAASTAIDVLRLNPKYLQILPLQDSDPAATRHLSDHFGTTNLFVHVVHLKSRCKEPIRYTNLQDRNPSEALFLLARRLFPNSVV